MKAVTAIKTEMTKLFACPDCGSMEHSYGHLSAGDNFGPWYCDKCGCSASGVVSEDGVDIERGKDRKARTLVLLRLNGSSTNTDAIHIVVEGMVFYPEGGRPVIDLARDEYFYNEHTCPWNYLRLPIKKGDDCDPHGLFVHQETVLAPEEYCGDLDTDGFPSVENWREIFPSLRGGRAA